MVGLQDTGKKSVRNFSLGMRQRLGIAIALLNTPEKLLLFYEAYISKCCLHPFYNEYGNIYIVVDMELKGRIREALLKMICEFEIDEH